MMKIEELFSVKNKIVLVTGGSRGIGEMIASAFLANGAKVYISSRKKDSCDNKAIELSEKYNAECISIPGNAGNLEGIKNIATQLSDYETKLDILVNNAGAAWGEPIDNFSEEGWDKVMDLNLKGLFFMSQQLLPLLRQAGSLENPSRIINIGSIDGINTPSFENYSYSASKAAVHHLTRVLAARLIKDHILVNAIAPGAFPSVMLGRAIENNFDLLSNRSALKRIGTPEDIGGLVLYLSSRAGNYTIGETISCDGGAIATAGHNLTNS